MVADKVPQPDPTALTTEQLHREITALRQVIEARLDGMQHASELVAGYVNRVPGDTATLIMHLRELVEQRFAGVDERFEGLSLRGADHRVATESAIASALQAQKDAATKSEAGITEKLSSLAALLDRSLAALGEKVTDLGSRADRAEAMVMGISSQRNDGRQNIVLVIMSASLAAALVSIAIGLLLHGGLRP